YDVTLKTDEEVSAQLRFLAEGVARSLEKHKKHGKTIVLKVRYHDFETITRRKTLLKHIHHPIDLYNEAMNLWEEIGFDEKEIRLLGVTLTNLDPLHYRPMPLPLFEKE